MYRMLLCLCLVSSSVFAQTQPDADIAYNNAMTMKSTMIINEIDSAVDIDYSNGYIDDTQAEYDLLYSVMSESDRNAAIGYINEARSENLLAEGDRSDGINYHYGGNDAVWWGDFYYGLSAWASAVAEYTSAYDHYNDANNLFISSIQHSSSCDAKLDLAWAIFYSY